MRCSNLLVFYTVIYGLLIPTGLAANIPSDYMHDLEERASQCSYHCKQQGVAGDCIYVFDRYGELHCTTAPPPSEEYKAMQMAAQAAEKAGVKLQPNTAYYFHYCHARPEYETHGRVAQWIYRQTGCQKYNIIIGKTSADNKEFAATLIESRWAANKWVIESKQWKGYERSYLLAVYGGLADPDKLNTYALMNKAAEWDAGRYIWLYSEMHSSNASRCQSRRITKCGPLNVSNSDKLICPADVLMRDNRSTYSIDM
ncbi:hypothetical protein LZ31DRAFT_579066 [Colletotrichum somersetense]|nr:hypothetical protein LZ31DRAFT_579066 [Colletotrichum somersetense]